MKTSQRQGSPEFLGQGLPLAFTELLLLPHGPRQPSSSQTRHKARDQNEATGRKEERERLLTKLRVKDEEGKERANDKRKTQGK